MTLCLATVRYIIDQIGGDAVRLALSTSSSSEEDHIEDLMDTIKLLEDKAKHSACFQMRKKIVRKIITSDIPSYAKADLIEEIFEMEIPPK